MKSQYKHLLNFFANLVTVLVEGGMFAYLWYMKYSMTIKSPFYRRGNWAVIGFYLLILFFFTKTFRGYKIGYLKTLDIIISHILAIFLSGISAYFLITMVGRTYFSPKPLVGLMICQIAFIIPWVYVVRKLYARLYPPRKLLLIHGDYEPKEMIRNINSRKDKYDICGQIYCFEKDDRINEQILQHEGVILYDLPADRRNQILKFCYNNSIRTYVTPKISDIIMTAAEDIHLFDSPLLLSRNQGLSLEQKMYKRFIDIVISVIAIIVMSPIMLLIAICVKLYDGGPVFYKQERLTRDNRVFMIYKFRSMSMDSEVLGARLAAKNDSRVTPIGNIIRNLHLDEMPQLFNILKGDMSLVGPRPERPEIRDVYLEEIPEFDFRLKVKAGLTGYAQVYGKYNTSPYDKLKLDLTYIENYSIWLDFKLMLMTIRILFQKDSTEGIDVSQTTASRKNNGRKNDAI